MQALSVVILTKNAESTIIEAVKSALLVSADVIVVDSGSTDSTVKIAQQAGARTIAISWNGFGDARNRGAGEAVNDYILNIDADEVITRELALGIQDLHPQPRSIYGFRRMNFLGKKAIRHGEWGNDRVWRLYNKNETRWNLLEVHETLCYHGLQKYLIGGVLKHFTAPDIHSFNLKMDGYARLSAKKYLEQDKKIGYLKIKASPVFNIIKNYLFRLGILDGKEGWAIARAYYEYNKRKYNYLKQLKQQNSVEKER